MVKFQGIEISIISQFDIRKLPEFPFSADANHSPLPHRSNPTASCFVPIYPGSQIWFEYCIDGPHPPNAAYFFKFLLNGKVITKWDCTEKHDFHGKMMYNLSSEGLGVLGGSNSVVRQALKFGSLTNGETSNNQTENVIEIRVHRILQRKRVRNFGPELSQMAVSTKANEHLQLSNVGALEPGLPCRFYNYQLLDAIDEPYATFRFYYRTYDFLEWHGVVPCAKFSKNNNPSSIDSHDSGSKAEQEPQDTAGQITCEKPIEESSAPIYSIKLVSSPSDPSECSMSQETGPSTVSGHSLNAYVPPSDSEESLSILTRDSIEDLPSTVPRSPKSSKFSANILDSPRKIKNDASPPKSPSPSPRRRLKRNLTLNINGAEFNLDPKRRPLSPFTRGGMLRKLTGAVPPSAPAALTEFGPTLDEEIQAMSKSEQKAEVVQRTTRTERGGNTLLGFLGRRFASA